MTLRPKPQHHETATSAFKYVSVDLTQQVLTVLEEILVRALFAKFWQGRSGPPELMVGVGDTVSITIFRSPVRWIVCSQWQGSRPNSYVTLPSQTVDQKGYISIPYAGAVLAKGRTLGVIRQISSRGCRHGPSSLKWLSR